MRSSFIFFYFPLGNESLLIHWVNTKFPTFKLSFSAPGWVTFKSPKELSLADVGHMHCPVALRVGLGSKITNSHPSSEAKDIGEIHQFDAASTSKKIINDSEIIYNIYEYKPGKYATGYTLKSTQCPILPGDPSTVVPTESPSRAYLKIAQLDHMYQFNVNNCTILELGSSPGGITYYLSQSPCKHIYAADTGAMDADLLRNNVKITHLMKPAQKICYGDTGSVDWIVSDMNLAPDDMLQHVLKLALMHRETLKGLILTVKLVHDHSCTGLNELALKLKKNFPNGKYHYQQVPGHKKETALIAIF